MTRKAATTAADIPARNVPGANGSSLGKTNVNFPVNTRRCILRNQSCLTADSYQLECDIIAHGVMMWKLCLMPTDSAHPAPPP